MTCGIYLLKFNGTDKVYVGQSENIEYRYKKHKQSLKAGNHNYKMMEAYKEYGLPELVILLDDIQANELAENEILAFEIFDSVRNGFNVSPDATIYSSGELNPAAKYTDAQIEQAFNLLLNPELRYADVELETGVSLSTVRHIACLEAHTWLEKKYPEKYAVLKYIKLSGRKLGKNTAQHRKIEYPTILSPEGVEYNINNIAAFAKTHGLDPSSLAKVLKKRPKYNSHKGWKLKP